MRKRNVLVILVFILSFTLSAQNTITLLECYILSEKNYPEINRYDLIDKSEKYNISNAMRSWIPQISISAKASYQSDVTKLPFDDISSIIPGFEVPEISKDQYNVQGYLNQKIYDGGLSSYQKKAIAQQSEVSRKKVDVDIYKLRERINQLYFGCLLQKEVLEQNLLLQKELSNNIVRVDALIENGSSNNSDKQKLQVELLKVKQQSINIQSAFDSYKQMLSYMIGEDITEGYEFIQPKMIDEIKYENNRPELSLFQMQESLLAVHQEGLKTQLIPTFNLYFNGGYGRPGLDMLNNDFSPYYIAGVNMSWNISNFYTYKNKLKDYEVKRQENAINKDVFNFNTDLSILQQHNKIIKIKELMVADSTIAALRSDIKKSTQAKYENGTVSMTDLVLDIDAENTAKQILIGRKIELLSQIYNYLYITNQNVNISETYTIQVEL